MGKTRTDTLIIKLETDGSGKVQASLSGIEEGFERVDRGVRKNHSSLQKWGALAGTVAAGAMVAFAKRSYAMADSLVATAEKLGLNIETLQEYRFAAEQAGVEHGVLDMALQRFLRRAAEAAHGTGEARDALEELGVELTDNSGRLRDAEVLFGDVATAIAGMESEQERLRIAFKLFDSEGVALVNMLRDGSEGLEHMRQRARELGLVMDSELVRQAAEANREFQAMTTVISTSLTRAFVELAPAIVTTARGFETAVTWASRLIDRYRELGNRTSLEGLRDELRDTLDTAVEQERLLQRLRTDAVTFTDQGLLFAGTGRHSRYLESLEAEIDGLYAHANDLNARMLALQPNAPPSRGNRDDGLSELRARLAALSEELDPLAARTEAYLQAVADLDAAWAAGLISGAEHERLMNLLAEDTDAAREAETRRLPVLEGTARQTDALQERVAALVDRLDPAAARTRAYHLAVADLAEAWAAGIISGAEYDRLLQLLAEDTDTAREAAARHEALMTEGADLARSLRTPQEQLSDELTRYVELAREGAITQETLNRAVTAARERYSEATQAVDRAGSSMVRLTQHAAEGMHDALRDLFYRPWEDGLEGMVSGWADALHRMASELLASELLQLLGGWAKGQGGWLGDFGSALLTSLNAQGNVFSGGQVVPFAAGGVVQSPALFPMRNGLGLMGEAGPEAIMPLSRGADGKLGVRASGPGGAESIKVVLVDDRGNIGDYMASHSGERVLLQVLERNRDTVRMMLL